MTDYLRLNYDELEEMVDGYFTAAAWVTDDGTHERLAADVPADVLIESINDVMAFWLYHHDWLERCVDHFIPRGWSLWEQHGHDFYLTRNGHGVGFWDRGYGEIGRRLTEACKPYSASDDLNVYLMEEPDDVDA